MPDTPHSGPVRRLLSRLVDPRAALVDIPDIRPLAKIAYARGRWGDLADLYKAQAESTWREGHRKTALRLLIAEWGAAQSAKDHDRARKIAFYLAQRHRLSGGFHAAEGWYRFLLVSEPTEETAWLQAGVLRELASLRQIGHEHGQALRLCRQALDVCVRFADLPGMTEQHLKVHVQASAAYRSRGEFQEVLNEIARARSLMERIGPDFEPSPLVSGLLSMHEAGAHLVIGHLPEALAGYRDAEKRFDGVSELNVGLVRLRQATCLFRLGNAEEALAVMSELAERYRDQGDGHRLAQVLLEQAEVLHGLGDVAGARRTLEEARPLYEHRDDVEAGRWNRHLARLRMGDGSVDSDDAIEVQELLLKVLDDAVRPEREDLTRTLLSLHDLARLPGFPVGFRRAAVRVALMAADLQRDSLTEPRLRWALQAVREETHAAAVLLHADPADLDTDAVVTITEMGRSDLLDQLLGSAPVRAAGSLTELAVAPSTPSGKRAELFKAARSLADVFREGPREETATSPHLPMVPLPERSITDRQLDEMAEVIVVSHIGVGPLGHWSVTACRERGGDWVISVRDASGPVAMLLRRLSDGALFPEQGIRSSTWEALGDFLLPDPAIWRNGEERPTSVLICPDPRLWAVPYAALTRENRPLIDTAAVILTPSLRTQGLLRRGIERRDRIRRPGPAVSLLDPELPGHPVEVAALDVWPGGHRSLVDTDAPMSTADDLFYVSGHNASRGTVATLGPGNITLEWLAGRSLPPVAVLNGCWSGASDGRYGRDPLSLALGCLVGGAHTVVAGVGRIDELASAHVAAALLPQVASGEPVSTALRSAQIQIRDDHPELAPFDWASLCVIGSGGPYQ